MSIQLIQGERPLRTVRQHWSAFVPTVAACLLVLAVIGVLLRLLPSSIAGHSLHDVKVIILLAALVVAGGAFLVHWVRWRYLTYVLTDHRIVVSRGVLSRFTESIALDRIQDTTVRTSLLDRLLHCGDLEIESAGRDGSQVVHRVADPQGFANALLAAIEARRTAAAYGAPPGAAPPDYQPGAGYGPPPGYGPPRGHDGL